MTLSPEILNEGLRFSMEFGEKWLVDVDERLAGKYSELTVTDLRKCDKLCRKVNKTAHDHIRKNPAEKDGRMTFMDFEVFRAFILSKYDWVNDENMCKLYSQSCYYAFK